MRIKVTPLSEAGHANNVVVLNNFYFSMHISYIKDKKRLNEFISAQEHSQFLQSWQWGEFQEKAGNKVLRIGIEDKGRLVIAATLIKKALPGGRSYFYCPHGPIEQDTKLLEALFDEVEKLAKKENAIFLRFEPNSPITPAAHRTAGQANYKLPIKKTIDIQPSQTTVLDLTKPEDDLLKAMHQKTRYNIRLAGRKGVKIIESQDKQADFEKFWRMMEDTHKRDRFRIHKKDHYRKMIAYDKNFIKLFLAEYIDKIISANIISFFGDTVTYMHGASSNEHRNVMAPFLLQWQVIKEAKAKGYKYYDFYGIDEDKYPGVTRFKRGFGGDEINYPGTFDLILNKQWYSIYTLLRKLRRLL